MKKIKRFAPYVMINAIQLIYLAKSWIVSCLNVYFEPKSNFYVFNYTQTFSDLQFVSNSIMYLNYGCESNYSLNYSCINPKYVLNSPHQLPYPEEMCGTFIGLLHFNDILYSVSHLIHNKKMFPIPTLKGSFFLSIATYI